METTLAAIYEQGSLRLLLPLELPESSEVQVTLANKSLLRPA